MRELIEPTLPIVASFLNAPTFERPDRDRRAASPRRQLLVWCQPGHGSGIGDDQIEVLMLLWAQCIVGGCVLFGGTWFMYAWLLYRRAPQGQQPELHFALVDADADEELCFQIDAIL